MFSLSSSIDPQKILEILKTFRDPLSGQTLIEAGLMGGVNLGKEGRVTIVLQVPAEKAKEYEALRQKITEEISRMPNVEKALVVLTTPAPAHQANAAAQELSGISSLRLALPQIQSIIAIASGKGGVGKSLVALNLALAMKKEGKRVGILDADLYGPSLPKMMGMTGKPEADAQKRLNPLVKFGLQCMSMGFFVPEEAPLIWRGPMIQGSLVQFIRDVNWEALDVLVIDLPPGTGDIPLTLAQKTPLAGVVIVSTPQDLALLDARKGLHMFKKLHIPVLGLIENMSYFSCPSCGHRSEIFHHGGAREEAQKLDVPFLGEIPLAIDLRRAADEGVPLPERAPDHLLTKMFSNIAKNIINQINQQTTEKK